MTYPTLTSRTLPAGSLLAALLLGAVGCSAHPIQRQLAGRWHGDAVENVDGEALAAATGWAKGTSFEFAGSTLTVAIPAEEPRSGSYRVVKAIKDDVKLEIQTSDGQSSQLSLKLDDERALRWMIGDGRAVVMRREY